MLVLVNAKKARSYSNPSHRTDVGVGGGGLFLLFSSFSSLYFVEISTDKPQAKLKHILH